MKKQNKTTHCKSSNYSMENMENSEISEEEIGVWDKTKEGVAKAWSATKEGAARAWDKTKEVTEDITGFGHDDDDKKGAYFEEESFMDENNHHIHHSHGFAEDDDHFASFSETDGEMSHHPAHHISKSSGQHSSTHIES